LGQTTENYSIRREVEKLIQDKTVSRFFGLCVALNVYHYCSHYIFFWYGMADLDRSVYDYGQPVLYFVGAMTCGGFLAIKFDFKRLFWIVLIGNIASLIISIVGMIGGSRVILSGGQLPHSFFLAALKLLIYEFATEISYPVSPALALGLLHMVSNLSSMVIIICCDALGSSGAIFNNMINCAFVLVLCLSLLAFLRWPFKLNRIEVDREDARIQSL
jgi:hypothetical protein